VDHARHARALLAAVRETPMLRSNPKEAVEPTWDAITAALELEGVLPRLARRLAMQLVLKVDVTALGGRETWRALGAQLVLETERLRSSLGLVDRQIIVALPKLAPAEILMLLESLTRREPRVARTILNAALDVSEAAERYLETYRRVVASLSHLEPTLARTMANATFMARRPTQKAKHHLQQFAELVNEFGKTASTRGTQHRAERLPVAGSDRSGTTLYGELPSRHDSWEQLPDASTQRAVADAAHRRRAEGSSPRRSVRFHPAERSDFQPR